MTKHHRWTAQELALLGTMSDERVAEQLGLPRHIVARKSRVLGLKFQKQDKWTAEHVALLGTASDSAVAKLLGRKRMTVYFARRTRGIPAYQPAKTPTPKTKSRNKPQARSADDLLMSFISLPGNRYSVCVAGKCIDLNINQARNLKRLMQHVEIPAEQSEDTNQTDWVGGK